ncbi:Naringenin-chalcone synthase [Sphingomonas antarctica]|uniref:type III polyketide synthase n=1 Tax=Sphingomonas antarctica TaxID=2040274 RepID=UPI0039ED5D33
MSRKVAPLPRITSIAHAVPSHDIHAAFVGWAERQLPDRERAVFDRMAARAGIAQRWSVLPVVAGGSPITPGGFYAEGFMPPTSARMALYAQAAPELALAAIHKLGALGDISHVVVASCTGFTAPGIDQILCERLGLPGTTERLLIGFMGCYAGITALKAARTIVRSEPGARVLVVAVELSTLHLQAASALEPLLAMLQFADGAAAAIVEASGAGLALHRPFAATLPDSNELIRWNIGDTGFAMHLSGEVPRRIGEALADTDTAARLTGGIDVQHIDGWAVHAGGRSILDAVEHGLRLPPDALAASRSVLHDFGNMSSATLLFALAKLWDARPRRGVALAFGPGLAAEGLTFGWAS